jgi:hypothetical protein
MQQRLTVYLNDALYREIRLAADAAGQTLSVWVARAARRALVAEGRLTGGEPRAVEQK